MGFYFDSTAASTITKNRYTKKKIEALVFKSSFFAMIPKAPDHGGQQYVGALNIAPMASVSTQDSIAFTTGGASQYVQWQCPWKFGYASANVTGTAIDQTKGDENAMLDVIITEADRTYEAMGVMIGQGVWGNGGGAIGKFNGAGTVASTNPFTLATTSQIVNFYPGMIVNAATTNGTTGAVEAGSVTLASVDINNGTLTPTGNWSAGIATIANTDFLFLQGTFGATIAGVPAWIPDTNNRPQAGDSFNGVNRFTSDPTRTAGVFLNGLSAPKEESLFELLVLVQRLCGTGTGMGPTHAFANPLDYADICKSLSTRSFNDLTATAFENPQIGFKGIEIIASAGTIKLFPDIFVPANDTWVIDLPSWLMPSMGPVPKLLDQVDGIEWLRQAGLDAYQRRVGYRLATYCARPFACGVVTY